MRYLRAHDSGFRHAGLPYEAVIADMVRLLGARSYLEIGSAHGGSLAGVQCDAPSIDPAYRIDRDVIGAKKRAFFFQMTSDQFFCRSFGRHIFPGRSRYRFP
jgi:hypothetical protein